MACVFGRWCPRSKYIWSSRLNFSLGFAVVWFPPWDPCCLSKDGLDTFKLNGTRCWNEVADLGLGQRSAPAAERTHAHRKGCLRSDVGVVSLLVCRVGPADTMLSTAIGASPFPPRLQASAKSGRARKSFSLPLPVNKLMTRWVSRAT